VSIDSKRQIADFSQGWQIVRLGDIALSTKGKKPLNLFTQQTENTNIPYIDIKTFEQGVTSKWTDGHGCVFCEKDDVLLVWDGSRSGLVGRAPFGALGSTIAKITIPLIHKAYLYYFLSSKFEEINTQVKGSGTPHVNPQLLWNFLFPIPPLPEQYRIVAKIKQLFSELDKGVAELKKAREKLDLYRQSLLKAAFEGKLTEKWRKEHANQLESDEELLARIKTEREKRYQQQLEEWKQAVKKWETQGKPGKKPTMPRKPKELPPLTEEKLAELPKLPEGWVWSRFGEFIDRIDAGKSFKCYEYPPKSNQVGVAKVSAVTWGEYDENESKTCLDPKRINKKFIIKKGDFLFSRANTIDLVGACVIARSVNRKVMLSDKTLRIIFTFPFDEFFLHYLRSQNGRNEIKRLSTGNQESMRNIGQDRIRQIVTPICRNEEILEITKTLDYCFTQIDKIIQTIDLSLKQAETLRQAILKKAFSGKLVPQDPNDEPASELLKRIKAERGKAVKEKKPVRRRREK